MTAPDPAADRLARQLAFVLEIDRLKTVLRQTLIRDGSRRENSAEHSWHLALLAVVLQEYAAAPVDLDRVIRMLLVHDIVEIDAGDTFVYDSAARADQAEREAAAAERLFGLLPAEQGAELRAAWEEFEARATPEARFAAALDRLQPLMLNLATAGAAWQRHGIRRHQVLTRNAPIGDAAPRLWDYIRGEIETAVAKGWLRPD